MKDYYRKNAVSNTSLSWFEQSPLAFQKFINNELEQEEKPWLERGTQIHMLLLEPEEFEKNYIYLDYETPKSEQQKSFCKLVAEGETPGMAYEELYSTKGKSEERLFEEADNLEVKYRDYINYLKKSKEYKAVLSKSQENVFSEIKTEIYKHRGASRLLEERDDAFNECAIYFKDPNTDLDCKALIDRLIVDEDKKEITLIDIKTTTTFKNFRDKVRDYNYHRQLAFYWRAIFSEYKDKIQDDWKFNTYIIAINTKDLIEVKVFEIPENLLKEADDEINRLMLKIAWHYENDQWQHVREYYGNNGIEKL